MLQTVSTAHDEQDVRRVDLDKLLVRMFASALRWYGSYSAFQNLQQGLLYTFTGNVACDGRILGFACYFINFINIDNTAFGFSTS